MSETASATGQQDRGPADTRPSSRSRWSRWRFTALGVASIFLSIAVAYTAHVGLTHVGDVNRTLQQLNAAQRHHQDSDMTQDALAAAAYHALYASRDEREKGPEHIGRDVAANVTQLTADLDAISGLDLDPELAAVLADHRPRLVRFAASVVDFIELAYVDRPRAVATLEDLERQSAGLTADLGATTDRLARASRDAEQQAAITERQALRNIVVTTVAVLIGLTGLTVALNRLGASLSATVARLRIDAGRRRFGSELAEALEMADDEHAAYEIVEWAMDGIQRGRPMELLLADSSEAHLELVASSPSGGAPHCPVQSPRGCVAVQRAGAVTFPHSGALNACPKLRGRGHGPLSAACVPVSFNGRALGVLHATGADGEPPSSEEIENLSNLAKQASTRIGTLRAFAQTELQASTDGLTGLANRRVLETRARVLAQQRRDFALVLGDLDHFKDLNDTYGHDAGDRALRLFARNLRAGLRVDDLAARVGGEEFALILPGIGARAAAEVVERIRQTLAVTVQNGSSPPFTASYGVTDSSAGESLDELLRVADRALYRAKNLGRDRVVTADQQRATDNEAAAPGNTPMESQVVGGRDASHAADES